MLVVVVSFAFNGFIVALLVQAWCNLFLVARVGKRIMRLNEMAKEKFT